MGATTSRRLPTRSRGLSDISNASHGSIHSSNNTGHRSTLGSKLPRLQRQAPSPIGVPTTQRTDGFVRFLQQHASPPHHRVTAGGRIVPAGPASPPPMLDYDSLNSLMRGKVPASDSLQNERRSALSSFKLNASNAHATASMNPLGYSIHQDSYQAGSMRPMVSPENAGYAYEPLFAPPIQTATTMVPIGAFPDGSNLVSYNGVNYRAYWNGSNTIMEPLQPFQLPVDQQAFPTTYNVSPYGLPFQSVHTSNMSGPLTNITNGSQGTNHRTSDSSTDDKETTLKSQLTNLDKHLALYHFEIKPVERAELVAHRRYLVEAIDRIRVSKENTKRSIPIIAPATGMPITPVTNDEKREASSVFRGAASQDRMSGKGLSPAAVPFVPGRKASTGNHVKRTLEDVATAAVARKDKALQVTQIKSRREFSSSSVLDPSDPAMRIIDYEDIEYASRYLYNWDLDTKRYCTTISEFQEAIRQVREQARRYGCLGGQSKDPAYDAEQDLWWAICDRDPIPLPTKVPDYILNPRPWNWEDSAFNFRRMGAPFAGRGVDDARNSPRLMGWDPAVTESMKDTIDVSRSYFALKGQLPSVPFRTWALDRKGNKVEIASKPEPVIEDGVLISQILPATERTANIPTSPASHQPLRVLSANELNSRNTTQNLPKASRKMYATDGDLVAQSMSEAVKSTPLEANSKDLPKAGTVDKDKYAPGSKYGVFSSASMSPKSGTQVAGDKAMIDPNSIDEYPIYDSDDLACSTLASLPHSDQLAETRSQWGPEEDSQSMECKMSPEYPGNSDSGNNTKTARVSLPVTTSLQRPVEPDLNYEIHKIKSINSLR